MFIAGIAKILIKNFISIIVDYCAVIKWGREIPCIICWISSSGNILQNYISQTVQFSSVTQLSLTLCDPMDCSMPDLPVHH